MPYFLDLLSFRGMDFKWMDRNLLGFIKCAKMYRFEKTWWQNWHFWGELYII